MKISGWESLVVRPPLRHKGRLGVGDLEAVENVLLIITTDEGLRGIGEASPWPVFAETPWGTKDAIDRYLMPSILGEDPRDVEAHLRQMNAVLSGFPFAKAAVEMALLDIAARAAEVPVYRLLGGRVRGRVPLSHSIANQVADEDADEIVRLLAQGIRIFKVKTGVLPLPQELRRLERLQRVLREDADLRLDFNQGLARETALFTVRALEAFNPTFMEQPLPKWDIEGMAQIAAAIDTPIMADESVFSPHDALRVVQTRAADIVSIKIMKPGGILASKRVAAICEAAGLPCYAGAMWESGVGIAASLHFAASTPNVTYGSDFYIPNFLLLDDLIEEPLRVENGSILVPEGPGLGVQLDVDAVASFRVS
jgi:muconate cycloisomerase